jgi:hypothetical protein
LPSHAVELKHCTRLKELNVESNRITNLVLDLRPLKNSLHSLQVGIITRVCPETAYLSLRNSG